jgi:hypothetical protein
LIVSPGADGKPDPGIAPILRTGLAGIPVVDPVTMDFDFVPADPTNPDLFRRIRHAADGHHGR